jgi:hypothetical protein
VGALAAAFSRGLRSAGMAAVAKQRTHTCSFPWTGASTAIFSTTCGLTRT